MGYRKIPTPTGAKKFHTGLSHLIEERMMIQREYLRQAGIEKDSVHVRYQAMRLARDEEYKLQTLNQVKTLFVSCFPQFIQEVEKDE